MTKILERNNALHYRNGEQQQDLLTLLKLLAGFPLALEVVLANLKQQTPKQVLQALQTGDERIDFASDDKTQSILRCIDYSHSALSANAQQLLLCLAPFKGVLYLSLLGHYSEKLQAQPALANLAFTDWQTVLAELQNWGLISPHEVDGFISLQPTLSYFLNHRLREDEASLQGIHSAFREVYDIWGNQLYGLMESKETQEKQLGQYFTKLEYENLSAALQLALAAQVSTLNFHVALSVYLDSQQAQQQGLELGMQVLLALENYPQSLLQGLIGVEFVALIDDIAKRQLLLKRYSEAEQNALKALSLTEKITVFDKNGQAQMQALAYQRLGEVALEQRQFLQAQNYYQKALTIEIKINNGNISVTTYNQLGRIEQEQRHWQQAHDYYLKALDVAVRLNNYNAQALIYHNLGFTTLQLGNYLQAQNYYQQSLDIEIELNDPHSQAITYHQLGNAAVHQKKWKQANNYYQKALEIRIKFNDCNGQANTYLSLGAVAHNQKQWQQAFNYFQQSLKIYIEFVDYYRQTLCYQNIGSVEREQKNWQKAQDYYLQALTIFVEFKDEYHRNITLINLSRLYQKHPASDLAGQIATILNISAADALAVLEQDLVD